ncbi:MAG: GNAT family N-acetyltransferase [Chitinophagaceae bacterium]|nr:MAG: GNAT family N-acetyltransferase [Chitinophagaceae bacterium]
MEIKIDDLTGKDIFNLLSEHLRDMYLTSPPESVHALDLDGLRIPEITFWTIWDGDVLAGCGALRELNSTTAEIKSMRTANGFRRKGVAASVLNHIIGEATRRNYKNLYLETGSMEYFEPARKLYEGFGFNYCEPFGDYVEDPNSVFMVKKFVDDLKLII